jgi:hypothetical protein
VRVYAAVQAMPRWIVFNELVLTSKEFVRTVSEIKPGAPPHVLELIELTTMTRWADRPSLMRSRGLQSNDRGVVLDCAQMLQSLRASCSSSRA